jgi:deoxyhypusine synthase
MSRELDLKKLKVLPLAERNSMATLQDTLVEVTDPPPPCDEFTSQLIDRCVMDIKSALERKASVMLIYGAHLIKNGGQLFLNQMMDRGWLSHLATNGAGIIHDWEFTFRDRNLRYLERNRPAYPPGAAARSPERTGLWRLDRKIDL